ncbi:peptide-methionine (R)-S-oxide reductase MsrB (plasmid) [Bartonella sp. HY329]|uniref:peptide-methionine (R)-S-oxide reductase MsrB n=1 Tax=unclassified Bartonella TaxID=2645622 RepID=UPI0021C7C6C6|nr:MULTISPECIES: peptide-methionine (R)-S-oxide reductase MsrB [unclassified Bartonella]UXM96611.1 peptide-methionine (R)-S-oxide reductase MsrB [Bartonella sp. HY329]UXN10934.1 peptide-methionine (R)-S-oxide reductase MsrB [Bartonella sp. HY328]
MINRRGFLLSGVIGTGALGLAWQVNRSADAAPQEAGTFPVSMSDDEWKKRLNDRQYRILRQQGTERPYSSPLNDEHRRGTFACAGCANDLFASSTKFDSGTGWPSFWAPLKNAVGETKDTSYGMVRVEVHCAQCGGHLGHVFNDGPKPTGLRYCMNGDAMTFKAI